MQLLHISYLFDVSPVLYSLQSCFATQNAIYFAQAGVPFDPVIPPQNFPKEIIRDVQKDLCSRLFTEELIMQVKLWKLELIKQYGAGLINYDIYIMEHSVAIKNHVDPVSQSRCWESSTSESPGKLFKMQISGPHLRFMSSILWVRGLRILIFQMPPNDSYASNI